MSDIDMDFDNDFDSSIEVDANNDSDFESLDSNNDIIDASYESADFEVDSILEGLDLDFDDNSYDEINSENLINEISDDVNDSLNDLDDIPDFDTGNEMDADFMEDVVEILEGDDVLESDLDCISETNGLPENKEEFNNIQEISRDSEGLVEDIQTRLSGDTSVEQVITNISSGFDTERILDNTSQFVSELNDIEQEVDTTLDDIDFADEDVIEEAPLNSTVDSFSDLTDEKLFSGESILDECTLESSNEIIGEIDNDNINELEMLSLDELDEMMQVPDIEQTEEVDASTQEVIENFQEAIETIQTERDRLTGLRDELIEMQFVGDEESEEGFDGESPLVLTREITSEVLESRERDTEEVLENYRDNLREYGVEEEQIEEFVSQEREKINAEYESLDRGYTNTQIYEMPTDWARVADSLINQEAQDEYTDEHSRLTEFFGDSPKQISEETQEFEINYEEIYEGIQQETLEQGFEDIDIDLDSERLEESLLNFTESNWESLSLDEQKNGMSDLASYVVDIIGFENPPSIEYYNNAQMGDFGGYDASTNTLNVNEYMLYNSEEAADTIAHELWHAHQHECAMHPQSARDYQYQYNFINYIPPDLGQEAYESQLIEAEARAFAAQFKDRLSLINGRSR